MNSFVEDYPADQARTLAFAIEEARKRNLCNEIDEDLVYRQIASPEFRLYEEIILCNPVEEFQADFVSLYL